jgi:hypothetical protein
MVPRSEAEAAESQLALCRGETAALRARLADQEAGMVAREAELRSKVAESERRTEKQSILDSESPIFSMACA